MKYQVIARRYRPRRFEEVVGQDSVAATLRGAIQQDRIAHAYLFTGPRGVGKTSMARIFAKALNCERAADRTRDRKEWGTPCDACFTCEAIHTGQDIDVVELDGASHRGIEDIRSIIEGINRPATRSPFKVYIIDEVHMLTREAFNALLKTLEEPPSHVKFIFATTEAHRIPETVLSRCQRFDFHPIGGEAIVIRLSQILASEGRTAEPGLLEAIARYGKGGLRDAQTLLDQLMTFSEGELGMRDLERMTGRIPQDAVGELLDAALGGDAPAVLERVRASFATGADPAILLEQAIDGIRERLHAAVLGPEEGRSFMDRLMGALQILLDASSKLKTSPSAEASVEIVLLKISRLEDPAAIEDVVRSLLQIERREERPSTQPLPAPEGRGPSRPPEGRGAPPPRPAPGRGGARVQASPSEVLREPAEKGASPAPGGGGAPGSLDFRSLLAVWGQIGIELEEMHPDIAPYVRELSPVPAAGKPDLFVLEIADEFYFRQMKSPQKLEAFLSVVREVTRAPWKFRLEHAGKSIQGPSPSLPDGDGGGDGRECPGPPPDPGPKGSGPPAEAPSGRGGGDAPASPPGRRGGSGSGPGRPDPPSARGPRGEGIAKSPIVKKSMDLFNGRLV